MAKPKILSDQQFRETAKDGGDTADVLVRKAMTVEVKAAGDGSRSLDFVISTDSIDRYGDTIAVDGWNLANYRKNPVVLWSHDASMMPIAKASNIRVEDGVLKANAEFMGADISPFADSVFKAIKGGFLSAVSVGFIPNKWAFSEEDGRSWGIDYSEQELLEFSVCPIPANPEALVEARAAGIDIAPLRDWAVKVLAADNLALIATDRLEAINALATEFRTDAKKAASSKGASGIYRRCANRVEKAITGKEKVESEPAIDPTLPAPSNENPPAAPVAEGFAAIAARRLTTVRHKIT